MDLRVFTEPQQGATYDQLLRVARRAEENGFDAFFRSDHYLKMGDVSGQPGPTDAWVTLAGLARETSTIRLGTLMSAATFRLPGPLAVQVAQVDQMSGGRVELGIGSGWYAAEHAAFGIPFGSSMADRFDRYAEQLEIVTGLWATPAGQTYCFDGAHYRLRDAPGVVHPAQRPHPPILLGGTGRRRTPALAARYADEFNAPFASPEDCARLFGRVRTACRAIGRDESEVTMSVALVVCCAADEAGLARRAEAIGRDVDELRANGLAGSPAEVVERIGTYHAAGARRVYLQLLDIGDLDHLDLLAADVAPQLPG